MWLFSHDSPIWRHVFADYVPRMILCGVYGDKSCCDLASQAVTRYKGHNPAGCSRLSAETQ